MPIKGVVSLKSKEAKAVQEVLRMYLEGTRSDREIRGEEKRSSFEIELERLEKRLTPA